MKTTYLLICISLLLFSACKKETQLEENPFTGIDRSNPPQAGQDTVPDPNGITGIYKNILSVKCANPGCHDGHFEPDFRTIQSAYHALVYAPVKKNTNDMAFTFRVIPGDVNASWLHERLITGDQVLGRMPLYSEPLNETEMQQIRTWIQNGAPDASGKLPIKPNNLPVVEGFIVTDLSNNRLDTVREDALPYMPILLPPNMDVVFYMLVQDDETSVQNLTTNQLKISLQMDDFSAATTHTATYFSFGEFQVWRIQLNTSAFTPGTHMFMRYYVGDGMNPGLTEFPKNSSELYWKTYASFKVQP
jgi:hypothetical protein